MSAIYVWPLPEVTSATIYITYLALVMAYCWWSVEAQTKIKLPHVLQLQSSCLHWPSLLHNIRSL